jgi:hypothetical protein
MEHKIKHKGIKIMIFWIVMPHRLLDRCRCFGGNLLPPFYTLKVEAGSFCEILVLSTKLDRITSQKAVILILTTVTTFV